MSESCQSERERSGLESACRCLLVDVYAAYVRLARVFVLAHCREMSNGNMVFSSATSVLSV